MQLYLDGLRFVLLFVGTVYCCSDLVNNRNRNRNRSRDKNVW